MRRCWPPCDQAAPDSCPLQTAPTHRERVNRSCLDLSPPSELGQKSELANYGKLIQDEEEAPAGLRRKPKIQSGRRTAQHRGVHRSGDLVLSVPFRARAPHINAFRLAGVEARHSSPTTFTNSQNMAWPPFSRCSFDIGIRFGERQTVACRTLSLCCPRYGLRRKTDASSSFILGIRRPTWTTPASPNARSING
jgi:hypothetical protein